MSVSTGGPGGPLRVLVVHNRYRSEQPSGEDRVVDQEIALLAGGGHRVGLFERRSDDIAAMSLPRRAAVPLRVPWNAAVRRELAALLRAERPDVVHIHSTFPLLSPSVVAACTDVGVPAVATLHNFQLVCPTGTLFRDGASCTECVGRAPLPAVRRGCYRGSALASVPVALALSVNRGRWITGIDRFFCISDAQRRILVAAGVPAERLSVKHHFVPQPGVVRAGAGEYVLYVGRLTEEKGLRLLMAAWDRLAAAGGVGMPLSVVGSGPLAAELAAWAGGRDDVRVLGLRDAAECARLMADAAAVVTPSTWSEPFGLVVVEAMAVGAPVVAADGGAFPELVDDGVTGLLHASGDAEALARAIRRVVADPDLNVRFGLAGRLRWERDFSPAAGLARMVAGYRAAMAAASCEPV